MEGIFNIENGNVKPSFGYTSNTVAAFLIGAMCVVAALILFVKTLAFIGSSESLDAKIVAVSYGPIPDRRTPTVGYIPTVELTDGHEEAVRIPVETWSREPVYSIGERINVRCDLSVVSCLPNEFLSLWGWSLLFGIVGCISTFIGYYLVRNAT